MPAVAEKPEVIEAVTIDPQAMPAVKYSPTDAELAKLRSQYEPLIADPDAAKSKEGYERCRLALQTLTPLRTGVNRMRLAANDGAQRFIKRNNELAADITAKIEAMETPIWEKKKAVDEEKERQKKAEAEAERAKIEAEIKAQIAQGVQAGHFIQDQLEFVAETITSSDLTSRTLRFTVRDQLATAARLFTFNVYLSRDAVIATT